MKNVLIVDDEKIFLKSLAEGLSAYAAHFNVITAENGKVALKVLDTMDIDLLVTDIKMPEMNGFELLAQMSRQHMDVPVVVMTAYGTPVIEEQLSTHSVHYMEKPLDINMLAETVLVCLSDNSKGFIHGITLPSFIQLVELEKKTYTLRVKSGGGEGVMYFQKGELSDAETREKSGIEAAREMLRWEDAEIDIEPFCKKRDKNISVPLAGLLRESMGVGSINSKTAIGRVERKTACSARPNGSSFANSEDGLSGLKDIFGFAGAAIFSPTGELLALNSTNGFDMAKLGTLSNDVCLDAQKTLVEMGGGRGQLVHIAGEKAHFIISCSKEDGGVSKSGGAHIRLVLILRSDREIDAAKDKASSIVESLAEKYRF